MWFFLHRKPNKILELSQFANTAGYKINIINQLYLNVYQEPRLRNKIVDSDAI
jgi:hypothetical protein